MIVVDHDYARHCAIPPMKQAIVDCERLLQRIRKHWEKQPASSGRAHGLTQR
jgi:hypothetical protein